MKTANSIEESKAGKTAEEKGEKTLKRGRGDASRIAAWKWKKGFCPNPGGRPKKDRAQEIAREVFEANPEAVYKAMAKALLKGNAYAFSQLADRAYGRLIQKQELMGRDGGPIELAESNDTDIEKRIADILRELGLAQQINEAGRVADAEAGTGKENSEAKIADVLP